jgi:hypothetical protein
MVASIWLQLGGSEGEALRRLIAALAAEHGTMPFEPHLTVCTIANPGPQAVEAAAGYIANCRTLPLPVRKLGISYSPTVPFRAVIVDVENTPDLQEFRETLRGLTGAGALVAPHISLLYTIDSDRQRTAWSEDEDRLRTIAGDCERRLAVSRFRLDRPILVAPDGDWTNIASWTTVRSFT